MKDKIQTYIQLYSGDVELNIAVTDKLKIQEDSLKNFGHITVSSGAIGKEECFWDNLFYFYFIPAKKFKKECGKELKEKGFEVEQTYKDIKRLLKRAMKLGILIKE
jgi:hypothetical protein